jgi:hypothetical protein
MRLWLPFLSGESGCQGQPLRHPRIHGDGQPFQSAAISPAAPGKEIEGDRFIRLRRGRKEKHVQRSLSNPDWPVNVWEWCEDVWDSGFYSKPEAAGPDPLSMSGSVYRALRGGCWVGFAVVCRSAYRGGPSPWNRDQHLGFRPAVRPLP